MTLAMLAAAALIVLGLQPIAQRVGDPTCPCATPPREDMAPWPIRGHQTSPFFHPAMFRTWGEFATYAADLKALGTTQLELAAGHIQCDLGDPVCADRYVVDWSSAVHEAGLNASLWWPCGLSNQLDDTALVALFARMPQLDSVFFPGGDAAPACASGLLDFDTLARTVRAATHSHPAATSWISLQFLNETELSGMLVQLAQPRWLALIDGVEFGPHTRIPLTELVGALPPKYLVKQYPDLSHLTKAQFELPSYHHAWAWTHGRQTAWVAPCRMEAIIQMRRNGSTPTHGFGKLMLIACGSLQSCAAPRT